MGASERSRNNVRAGLFVVLSILGGMVVTVFLSDGIASALESRKSYAAVFNVSGGVNNLQPGGKVRLGGVVVGAVADVELVPIDMDTRAALAGVSSDDPSLPPDEVAVKVEFAVDDEFPLWTNATIAVGSGIVGSEVWLDITSLGGEQGGAALASVDRPLVVRTAPGLAAKFLGPDGATDMTSIIATADRVMRDVDQLMDDMRSVRRLAGDQRGYGRVQQAGGEPMPLGSQETVNAVVEGIADILWWSDRLGMRADTILEDAGRASARIDLVTAAIVEPQSAEMLERFGEVTSADADNIAHAVAKVYQAISSVEATTDSVRGPVERFMAESFPTWTESIEQTIERVRAASDELEPTIEVVTTIARQVDGWLESNLVKITETVEQVRDGSRYAKRMLAQAGPNVDAILVDSRITAQQAKLMIAELRRSPWRVLYSPDDAELDNELLFESARALALAASRLEVATEQADRLLETARSDDGTIDPDIAELIRQTLSEPLRTYGEAQQRLLSTLSDRTTASARP